MKTRTLLTALLAASLNLTIARSQEKGADPYVAPKKDGTPVAAETNAAAEPSPEPKNLSICYEAFSVPLAMAATLQRSHLADPDLYAKLTSLIEKNEVKQETFTVIRNLSSQKATSESIQEQIYPTEYEAARIPNLGAGEEKNKKAAAVVTGQTSGLVAPVTPTAFSTRNVGFTLLIEPTLSADEKSLDLRLIPEHVTLASRSKWGQSLSEVEMPEFESQRINTAVTVKVDRPFLLGTMNPPPATKVESDSAKTVWFAFVTATLSK